MVPASTAETEIALQRMVKVSVVGITLILPPPAPAVTGKRVLTAK
jgi:hypothetical protein